MKLLYRIEDGLIIAHNEVIKYNEERDEWVLKTSLEDDYPFYVNGNAAQSPLTSSQIDISHLPESIHNLPGKYRYLGNDTYEILKEWFEEEI